MTKKRETVGELRTRIRVLEDALGQVAVRAEYGTTGPGKCEGPGLSAKRATSLRLAISDIARQARGEA